jgi:hypothetical protein
VRVAEAADVAISMEVGNLTESVQVKEESPLLSTAESSLGQIVDGRRIAELATSGAIR